MPGFGDRFVNLLEDRRLASEPAGDLAARIERALALFPSGPVTMYVGGVGVLRGDAPRFPGEAPASVSWEFGPGGIVILSNGAVWRVAGPMDLGVERRFICLDTSRVELSGTISAIRPEWWGRDRPDVALRGAIELVKFRARARAPQVPVVLSGSYVLGSPLVIDAHDPTEGMEVALIGRHPPGDNAMPSTLRCAPGDDGLPPRVPLVEIGDGVRASFAHVAFDVRRGDASRAALDGAIVHRGFREGVLFRRCSFFFDHGDLVSLSLAEEDARGYIVERPTGRAVFEECWFEGFAERAPGTAIRVSERGSPRLRLDGCTFRGRANAMVAVPSGMIEMVGCRFAVESAVSAGSTVVTDLGGERVRDFPTAVFNPGVDVVVGRPARSRGEHIVQAAWERAKGLPGNPGPIGISVVHVQSTSARFLFAERHAAPADGFVSITGLVSRPLGDVASRVSCVEWRGAIGGGLLVQGSDVAGRIDGGVEPVFAPASRLRFGLLPRRPSLGLVPR